MAASLDQAHVEKKFKGVTTTQESIQSLSMWVMHHKAQHEKIVDIWFNVLKKSKLDHRLTLFYLCNDIVQMCRRKHAVMYKDAFKEVLKDATLFVRDGTVRPAIERIFKIWSERGIYDEEFTEELVAIINNTKARSTVNSKLLAEFQPLVLMEKVITLKRFEDEIELKRRQLVSLRMDASSIEAVRQLKDRTHGGEFCAEFESACTKMEDYTKSLEKEIADRTSLIELLEQSELYYDAQYGEAKIVANAYKNFGGRVGNLQKKLEEKGLSLPESVSPVQSPLLFDAPSPSPDNSPTTSNHVPDLVESPIPPGVTTPEHLAAGYDINTQHVDMEMSDEEGEQPASRNIAEEDSLQPSLSPKSDDDDMAGPQGSPLVVDHEDKKAAYIPSVAQGASSSFLDMMSGSNNKETTKDNDGGSTPVLDEFDTESNASKKKESRKDEEKPSKQRPIDFLAQLIGQGNNSGDSSSSSFFKNLSILTETVKTKQEVDDKSGGQQGSNNNTADQWAAWKALQGPPPKLSPPQVVGQAPQPVPPTPPGLSAPQLPPPPRIHPSLMPMPTPPFPTPLPPPPVIPPSQPESNNPGYPPPPQVDSAFPQPPPNYNAPPLPQGNNSNFPRPPNPPPQDSPQFNPQPPPMGNTGYRPPMPNQNFTPGGLANDKNYVSPPVSTATSPSYPAPPPPQSSQNFQGQTTPPTSYGAPPLTPTTPTSYPQQPAMYQPRFPGAPNAPHNNYAPPQTYTSPSPYMRPPPPTPPPVQQQGARPQFPGAGDQSLHSQRRDSWASNEPTSPSHSVHYPPPASRHRSNLTTIQTVDDHKLNTSPNRVNNMQTNSNSGGFMPHQAGARPATSPTTPDRRVGGRGDDGQMEFIEKLKMKSGHPTPNHSSNLRTLTEVPMDTPDHHNSPFHKDNEQKPQQRHLRQHQQGLPTDEDQAPNITKEDYYKDAFDADEDDADDIKDEDNQASDDNTAPTMGQTVGSFLQQIRREAGNREPTPGDNTAKPTSTTETQATTQTSLLPLNNDQPPSPESDFTSDFAMDRNHHSFQEPPFPHHSPRGRPPFNMRGGRGGGPGADFRQRNFDGSRFRFRNPEGLSPRPFSGPHSPFDRPPQRGNFGPRHFGGGGGGGFPNKRLPMGMGGRPFFHRPRF